MKFFLSWYLNFKTFYVTYIFNFEENKTKREAERDQLKKL